MYSCQQTFRRKIILALSIVLIVGSITLLSFGQIDNPAQTVPEKRYKPELVIQTGATSLVNSVAIAKGGKIMASGGGDNAVRLWDVKTGRQLKSFYGHSHYILAVAFSPDGKTLASGGFDNTIRIWDVESGKQIRLLEGHEDFVFSLAFSPDGNMLASGSKDNTAKLWNLKTGKAEKTINNHTGYVFSVALSPDGKILATGSTDKTIMLWDAATGKLIKKLEGHTDEVLSVAFSPDGKTLASGSMDNTVRLWDVETGEFESINDQSSLVYAAVFSPDGKILAIGGGDKDIKLWDVEKKAPLKSLVGHPSYVKSIAISEDNRTLASGGTDNTLRLWDIQRGEQIKSIKDQATHLLSTVFSADGKKLATATFHNAIKVWNLETGQQIKSLEYDAKIVKLISAIAFSPDGKILASGDNLEKSIRLWDLESGKQIESLKGHKSWIHSIVFSPDGKVIASGSEDNTIGLWDIETGAHKSLTGHTAGVKTVAFSWDAETLASGSADGTVKLWNIKTGKEIESFASHKDEVSSVAFSKDGTTLASGSFDKTILLRGLKTRQARKSLTGHADKINSIAFSPDGKNLVSGGSDGSVFLWDVETGKYQPLEGHPREVSAVAFSPDKDLFATSSADATLKLWRSDSVKSVATLISLDKDDWVAITPDSRFNASPEAQKLMHYVYGFEIIELDQLKEMYYDPKLLQKLLGFSNEPLRSIIPLENVKLYPEILEQNFDEKTEKLVLKLKNRGGGIGETRVLVNDKLAAADARDERLKANPNIPENEIVTLTVDLKGTSILKGKKNKITVITSNYLKEIGKGNIQSRGVETFFEDNRKQENTLPSLYAIVGGVSDYDGDEIDLRFAAKDAEDFSNALSLGARRLFCEKEKPNCLDKVQITTLSTSGKEGTISPTKENFRKAFADIAAKAKPEDIVVIYLAGHGVSFGIDTDTYFYLTKEARSANKKDLETVFQTVAISSTELTEWLTQTEWVKGEKGIKALKQVLILDTCAAGTAAKDLASLSNARDLSGDQIRAIEFLKDKTGTFILMGSAASAPSYESSQYGQGLLTYSLLQAMKGAALDNERVDVRKLFSYAEITVPNIAKNIGVQRPVVSAPLGNTFPIGQMTDEERQKIILPQPKPIMLPPVLGVPPYNTDPLNLNPKLKKLFDIESSYQAVSQRGGKEPPLIYIESDDFPGAVRLMGTYGIEGSEVKVKAALIRDQKVFAELPEIISTKEKVLDELLSAVRKELTKIPVD